MILIEWSWLISQRSFQLSKLVTCALLNILSQMGGKNFGCWIFLKIRFIFLSLVNWFHSSFALHGIGLLVAIWCWCWRAMLFINTTTPMGHRWFKEENEQLIPLQLSERISMASAGLLKITKVRYSLPFHKYTQNYCENNLIKFHAHAHRHILFQLLAKYFTFHFP